MTHDDGRTPTEANNMLDKFESNDLAKLEDLTGADPEAEVVSISIEELTDRDTGLGHILHQLQDESALGSAPTGGDIDADQYQSKVSGEEAVGGTAPTPDQNVVEDLATSEGIRTPDEHPLRTLRMMQERDAHRWELEPESSDDYKEHSS